MYPNMRKFAKYNFTKAKNKIYVLDSNRGRQLQISNFYCSPKFK